MTTFIVLPENTIGIWKQRRNVENMNSVLRWLPFAFLKSSQIPNVFYKNIIHALGFVIHVVSDLTHA